MIVKVPPPPKKIKNPQKFKLHKGDTLYRVHSDSFPGNAFNPCGGGATRFAPIYNPKGECIPSLYGASSLHAAIYETVFHDAPPDPGVTSYSVPYQNIIDRDSCLIEVQRDITLLQLRAPDLKNYGIEQKTLIGSPAEVYKATARWAEAFHTELQDIEGLVWTSKQCDPDSCYLFFGDRVDPGDLEIVERWHALDDDSYLICQIIEAGLRAGIRVSLPI